MQVSSIPLGRREGRAERGQERGSPLSRVSITQCRSLHVARANPGHVIPLSQLSYCGCPRGVRRGRVHDLRIIAAGAMPKAGTYVGLTRWLIPYDTAFAVRVSRPSLRRDRTRVCRDKCRLVRVPAGCAQRGDPGTTQHRCTVHTQQSSRLTDTSPLNILFPLILLSSPRMIRRCNHDLS